MYSVRIVSSRRSDKRDKLAKATVEQSDAATRLTVKGAEGVGFGGGEPAQQMSPPSTLRPCNLRICCMEYSKMGFSDPKSSFQIFANSSDSRADRETVVDHKYPHTHPSPAGRCAGRQLCLKVGVGVCNIPLTLVYLPSHFMYPNPGIIQEVRIHPDITGMTCYDLLT